MSKIFENGSDTEPDIKTDNEYAKNYDVWRKKEELNKLKTKYGEDVLEEDSSSSSDDEEVEITEVDEKSFFKALAFLKSKDPRIYDENFQLFDEATPTTQNPKKKKKDKPMYIGDYERELILSKNGNLTDSDEEPNNWSPTYVEEQRKLKTDIKEGLNKIEDDNASVELGGMFNFRKKNQKEEEKEGAEYREWLLDQKKELANKDDEKDLKPLKDYWNNPNLDDGEKFLRDYILNKRYLSNENEDYIPTYEEIVHDSDQDLTKDEEAIEKQEQFEHKYNFRFEEPDPEFVKRYPRTIEQSLRKSDDKRKLKRAETKERKRKEKEQKMQEIKKLQELKRHEIEEKIEKLKEITGNNDLDFRDDDFESDFDPEAHDKRMQSLFNEEFYEQPGEEQKPKFPDMDEYLELENWEKWDGTEKDGQDEGPHCEDEDFNMDADYDPQASTQQELIHRSKGKKKRKRKSLFAKAVSEPKPIFNPNDKTYEQYLDEYYKLDCEDIIGDIPCRFKYRKVIPNSFGLTIDEILTANERELNRWCSLKKAVQYRPDNVERYDQIAFEKKSKNLELKRRILPSLFESEKNSTHTQISPQKQTQKNRNQMQKNMKISTSDDDTKDEDNKLVLSKSNDTEENVVQTESINTNKSHKKKSKNKQDLNSNETSRHNQTTPNQIDEPVKKIIEKNLENPNIPNNALLQEDTIDINKGNNKRNKRKNKKGKNNIEPNISNSDQKSAPQKRKLSDAGGSKKKRKKISSSEIKLGISDARLSAYGINPKKFKNKMKYKKD